MQSHPEYLSPEVKKEDQSNPEFLSPEVKKEVQSHPDDVSPRVKEEYGFDLSGSLNHSENIHNNPSDVSPLDDDDNDDEVQILEPGDEQYYEAQKQLVLYDPGANNMNHVEPISEPTYFQPPVEAPRPRVLPSVGAFTVQCANCFKWRLIPTKEIYEQIRETILQEPFQCERAREWKPNISCDEPADISQDGSRLWAIDKPNIAKPPRGWERLLRIRGEGSTKFADVYYSTPTGKKLRSMVDVQKYLVEHPEYMDEVSMSQFSFQIPKPLQENYVRKRPSRADLARTLGPSLVTPMAWADPIGSPDMFGGAEISSPYVETPDLGPTPPPAKRKAIRSPSNNHRFSKSPVYNHSQIKIEEPQASGNSAYDP